MPPSRPSTARPTTAKPVEPTPTTVDSLLSLVSSLPVVHQTKNQHLRQCAAQDDEAGVATLLSFPAKTLLDRVDVNDSDEWGKTALHYACANGNDSMTDDLLHHGASVNQRDNNGATPLHAACQRGHLSVVQKLITAKANVNAVTHSGFAPLMKLAAVVHSHTTLVAALLLQHKAKIDAVSKDGIAALHIAVQASNIELVTFLLEKGANVNIVANDGRTPLHISLETHKHQLSSLLLSFGASVDMKDDRGQTARDHIDAAVLANAESMKHKRELSHAEAAGNFARVQHAWKESAKQQSERTRQVEEAVHQELNTWRERIATDEANELAEADAAKDSDDESSHDESKEVESSDDDATEAEPVEEETEEERRKKSEFRAKMFSVWERSHSVDPQQN